MHNPTEQALARRLHQYRTATNLTKAKAANATNVRASTWSHWELGRQRPQAWRLSLIAQALGIPVAQLFTDELVVAEVRVSDATLEDVRRRGRVASQEAAERIARGLEPLIYGAATRPAPDPDYEPRGGKPRRTREAVLRGVKEANMMRAAALKRRGQQP